MSTHHSAEKDHSDPYCVTHCHRGFNHSQCGCFCNHSTATWPSAPPQEIDMPTPTPQVEAIDRFVTDAMNRGVIPMRVAADLAQYLAEEWVKNV